MLIARAFLCAVSATDCEREAVVRATVGQGATLSRVSWTGSKAQRAMSRSSMTRSGGLSSSVGGFDPRTREGGDYCLSAEVVG